MSAVKSFTSRVSSITGILCLVWIFLAGDCAAQAGKRVAVVVSQRILPYMLVLEGINKGLAGKDLGLTPYYLGDTDSEENTRKNLHRGEYDLLVAIGPEAVALIQPLNMPWMYSAVLTPPSDSFCGVSLQIPVHRQASEIGEHFISVKRVGLLFDPGHNEWFYDLASKSSAMLGIKIIPLRVPTTDLLSSVLRKNWDRVDCLWMIPDPTIISESLVQYIIKQALFQKKGVFGYNPFFIQSGALFAFEFDYEKLGEQTAAQALQFLFQGTCSRQSPVFRSRVNKKIARKLEIQWKGELP